MTDHRISQFTPDAQRRIADAVRRVERSALRETGRWADVPDPFNRVIRWGRTTTNYDYPTYPSSGGTYVVEMGEYQPDTLVPGDTPDKTFTAYDPAWTEVAVDPTGSTIAQGTVVRVELHDGQWWIRPSASAGTSWPLVRLYSGSWKSQYSTTSYLLNGYPADCKFTYYNGDASACGVTLTGDGASAYNTPLLTFNASGGEYLIIPNISGVIRDSSVTYTQTVTTGPASAGTSHTHDVDCPVRHFAFFNAQLFKRASGATLWGAAKAQSIGSMTLIGGNAFNASANGEAFSCSPMYIRDITAGDELLLRCFAYHTPSSGTVYFTYSIVELTIIRVLEDDTQSTVT